MARRYFEQMLDELELANFPGYHRWYSCPNPMFYPLPDQHHDFRSAGRFSRHDCCPMDYYRQPYWMHPGFVFPNFEPFCLLRRNDKRNFHSKGHHFSRDFRNNGEKRFFTNRKDDSGNFRVDRGKTDFLHHFERRFQPSWNREATAQHYQLPRDNRNPSRLPFRHSNIDPEDVLIDQHLHNFKQMFENRNPSTECLSVNEHAIQSGNGVNENAMKVDSSLDVNYCKSSEVEWKEQCDKVVKNSFPSDTQYAVSSNFTNNYESWYCPEEQQQIVDVLKEVNLRHDRQLKRDLLLSRGEQPCSDESVSSINDSQTVECTQKSSLSSDEEEDDIHILLSPGTIPRIPEAVNEEEELKSGYHEKSASDFFEEFQNIFTGSPEKKIINNMTKESMKKPLKQHVEEFELNGKVITDEDKNAVKTVLDFEHMDELSVKAFVECSTIISSSPKEIFNDISPSKNTVQSSVSEVTCKNNFSENGEGIVVKETINVKTESQELLNDFPEAINMTQSEELRNICSEATSNIVNKTEMTNIPPIFHAQAVKYKNNICNPPSSLMPGTPQTQLLRNKHGDSQNTEENFKIRFKNHKNKNVSSINVDCKKAMKNLDKLFQACGKEHYETKQPSETNNFQSKHCKENLIPKITSSSNKYFQKYTSVQGEENYLSMSEPFLMPKSKDVIYRRISISEIFNSVSSNSREHCEKLPDNKHHVQNLIKLSMNTEHLSPSEHLKQILGIGKNVETKKNISREINCLSGGGKEHFPNGNEIVNQTESCGSFTSKSVTLEGGQNVPQVLKAPNSPKYPCCIPVDGIKGEEMHCKTASDDFHYQTSKIYMRSSKPLVSKNCEMDSRSNCSKDQNASCSLFTEASRKTDNERNTKHDICNRSFKKNTPIEYQPKKEINNRNPESTNKSEEKGFETNNLRQASKGETNLKLQNCEKFERKDGFQTGRYFKSRKRESSRESLKCLEHKKSFKVNKSHKYVDSQTTVNGVRVYEEPCTPNKSKFESPRTKKKFKKKRKQKFFDDNDDKKSQTTDGNDNKQVNLKSVDYNYDMKEKHTSAKEMYDSHVKSKTSYDSNKRVNLKSAADNYDKEVKNTSAKDNYDNDLKSKSFVDSNKKVTPKSADDNNKMVNLKSAVDTISKEVNHTATKENYHNHVKPKSYNNNNTKVYPISDADNYDNGAKYTAHEENNDNHIKFKSYDDNKVNPKSAADNKKVNPKSASDKFPKEVKHTSAKENLDNHVKHKHDENNKKVNPKSAADNYNREVKHTTNEGNYDNRVKSKSYDDDGNNNKVNPKSADGDNNKVSLKSAADNCTKEVKYTSTKENHIHLILNSSEDDNKKINSKPPHDNYYKEVKQLSVKENYDNQEKSMSARDSNSRFYSRESDKFINIGYETYHQNKCKRTFLVTRKDNKQNRCRYSLGPKYVNNYVSKPEITEIIPISENKECSLGNSKVETFTPISNNKSLISSSNTKDLKFEEMTEANSEKRGCNFPLQSSSKTRDNYFKKYNYIKTNQYRDGNRYWRDKIGYSDKYPNSEKDVKFKRALFHKNGCSTELKNHIKQSSEDCNKNILDKSNCNDNVTITYKDYGQSVTSVSLLTPTSQREATSTGENVNTAKPAIPSPEKKVTNGECRCSSELSPKERYNNSKSILTPIICFDTRNSFRIHRVLLTLVSEIRYKTQQMLREVNRFVYLVEKRKALEAYREFRTNLLNTRQGCNDLCSFMDRKNDFALKFLKKIYYEQKSPYNPAMQTKNILNSKCKSIEGLILCALRKLNEHNCSEVFKNHFPTNGSFRVKTKAHVTQDSIAVTSSKFRETTILKKGAVNAIENYVLLVASSVFDNYLRNRRALRLNPSLDIYIQRQLRDILYHFISVELSANLQKSFHLFSRSMIDENLLQVLPLFFNILSVLAALHLPLNRNNLKELLDISFYSRGNENLKLPSPGEKEVADNYINNALKYWDILLSYFTDN